MQDARQRTAAGRGWRGARRRPWSSLPLLLGRLRPSAHASTIPRRCHGARAALRWSDGPRRQRPRSASMAPGVPVRRPQALKYKVLIGKQSDPVRPARTAQGPTSSASATGACRAGLEQAGAGPRGGPRRWSRPGRRSRPGARGPSALTPAGLRAVRGSARRSAASSTVAGGASSRLNAMSGGRAAQRGAVRRVALRRTEVRGDRVERGPGRALRLGARAPARRAVEVDGDQAPRTGRR